MVTGITFKEWMKLREKYHEGVRAEGAAPIPESSAGAPDLLSISGAEKKPSTHQEPLDQPNQKSGPAAVDQSRNSNQTPGSGEEVVTSRKSEQEGTSDDTTQLDNAGKVTRKDPTDSAQRELQREPSHSRPSGETTLAPFWCSVEKTRGGDQNDGQRK